MITGLSGGRTMEDVIKPYTEVLKTVPDGVVLPDNLMIKSALKKYWLRSATVRRIQKSKSGASDNILLPPDYLTPFVLTDTSNLVFDLTTPYALIGESKAHSVLLNLSSIEWINNTLTNRLAEFVAKAEKTKTEEHPSENQRENVDVNARSQLVLDTYVKLDTYVEMLCFIDQTYRMWVDESDDDYTDRIPTYVSWEFPEEFRLYAKDARAYLTDPSKHCRTIIFDHCEYKLYDKNAPTILRTIEAYATAFENNAPLNTFSFFTDVITANSTVDYYLNWRKLIFVRDESKFIQWFHSQVKGMLTHLINFMNRDDERSNDATYQKRIAIMQQYFEMR
jgi:hypothetical protein